MSKYDIDPRGYVFVEDAQLLFGSWCNFSGTKTQYSDEGKRYFNIIIDDPAWAEKLNELGWNVKFKTPRVDRDPDEKGFYYLKVNIKYGAIPRFNPVIWKHMGSTMIEVTEENIDKLDNDSIIGCDVVLRPYHYSKDNPELISAQLDTMHVVVENDRFMQKYEHLEG